MKTCSLVAVCLAISVAPFALGEIPAVTSADWPTYNQDVRGWRFNAAETSLSPANANTIVEKWRFPPKDSPLRVGVIHATPSVVNGHVYFGTATYPAFYKLRPDGSLAWSYNVAQDEVHYESTREGVNNLDFDNAIVSSALVTKDKVYFGNNAGIFFALDRLTGKRVWTVDTRSDDFVGHHPANTFMASPILADGKIVVGGGSYEHAHAANPEYECCIGRGFVIAFAPDNGNVLWKYDVGDEPAAYPEPIAIDDANGQHLFQHGPSISSVWSTPSYDEATGSVFFGTDVHNSPRRPTDDDPRLHTKYSAAVIAIDVKSGREKWVTQLNEGDIYNLAMSGYDPNTKRYKDCSVGDTPKIYTIQSQGKATKVVGVGCKNGGFYVIQADDGRMLNQTPIYSGEPKRPLDPSPSARMLALPSPVGGLQTGCATDGSRVFTNGIDWLSLNVPKRVGVPEGGRVTCLTPDLEVEHWRHERPKAGFTRSGDPVGSGIALGGGLTCFTTTVSGKLVILNARDGAELKSFHIGTVWSGPSLSRGRIYVGTGSILFLGKKLTGTLYSFGLPGIDEIQRMQVGDE